MRKISLILLIIAALAACSRNPYGPEGPDMPGDRTRPTVNSLKYTVNVNVKDTTYSNVTAFSNIARTTTDNSSYKGVKNICYTLQNTQTNEYVVVSNLIPVDRTSGIAPITFSNLPNGQYNLTIMGNVADPSCAKESMLTLHNNGDEGMDTYMFSTLLTFTNTSQTAEARLERTKGLLQVMINGVPNGTEKINTTVSSIFQTVNRAMAYNGSTSIQKLFLPGNQTTTVLEMFVSPSSDINGSVLDLLLVNTQNSEQSAISVPQTKVTINRNQITSAVLNYDTTTNTVDVWIYIDNEWIWTQIHNLTIEQIDKSTID